MSLVDGRKSLTLTAKVTDASGVEIKNASVTWASDTAKVAKHVIRRQGMLWMAKEH